MGWNEVSERGFDNLVYMCLGKDSVVLSDGAFCDEDFKVEKGCKLVFYSDNSHNFEGFHVCTEPGVAGMAPCSPEEGVIVPNESNPDGFCARSHPGYSDSEARDDETYAQLYGWSHLVLPGSGGFLNTRDFDIRGDKTGQKFILLRGGEIIKEWQGKTGPEGFPIQAGDVISFFADDSNSCYSKTDPMTGMRREQCAKGFEICVDTEPPKQDV